MEAIILCGGFGTRLRPVISDVPKPMAPIGEKPFLEILLKSLKLKGFSKVILSVGYLADKIIDYFGNSYLGLEIIYSIEEVPLGTGGATKLGLSKSESNDVFVLNGDTFLDFEVTEIFNKRISTNRPIIVARSVPDTSRYGKLFFQNGNISGLGEKESNGPGLVNSGCYVFSRQDLDGFEEKTSFSLEADYLAEPMIISGFDVFVSQGLFIDIGVPADYFRAQTLLAKV